MPEKNLHEKWIDQLRAGDGRATQQLWEEFFPKLLTLAQRRLQKSQQVMSDGEDVALSAFNSFFRGIRGGRFPKLADRSDLWKLLITITSYKAIKVVRDEGRQKRGGGQRAISLGTDPLGSTMPFEEMLSREPSPDFAAEVAEQTRLLLAKLPSQDLVELAVMKMEGYSNSEIAVRWNKAPRTVERKLNLIRQIWSTEMDDSIA